jgi:dephospho-CoA kinase
MIIAISGPICSGKSIFAEYFNKSFGFKIVNLYDEFE